MTLSADDLVHLRAKPGDWIVLRRRPLRKISLHRSANPFPKPRKQTE